MTSRPTLLGLVGGIASGKSTVARAFERRGARVLEADTLAKSLLDLPEVRRSLHAAFGNVETDGRVDPKKLAAAAFRDPVTAARLNAIVHPFVTRDIDRRIREWQDEGFRGVVVVDAPLLLEAGMKDTFDLVVFVDAPPHTRRARARDRGWADGELERREALQWPLDRKRAVCGAVVDAGGSLEEMERQVEGILEELRSKRG